jgi:fused signal recognition particle receptor
MAPLVKSIWQRIKDVALLDVAVLARGGPDSVALDRLEETLLDADLGVAVTTRLVADIERRAKRGTLKTPEDFRAALEAEITSVLQSGHADTELIRAAVAPTVILVLGVNGAGKTTFIGKLAAKLKREGRSVLVGAGDTFRAGAIEQLRKWAERSGAEFVSGSVGADPAAVAYAALDAGVARGCDTVIIDTAGRLHTSDALMDELRKVQRVVAKRIEGAPHEALLVLDGTIGQNAIAQATTFAAALPVTGLVVTKLDGSARGGIVVAVHEAINVPVKFVSTGEGVDDIEIFDAASFARSLLTG